MKTWRERYRNLATGNRSVDVLVGFNANIDVIHQVSELDLEDVEPREPQPVSTEKELRSVLKYCVQRGENREVELENEIDFPGGLERIGGQAGIMSNFLSSMNEGVIFYTPLLSEVLAQRIDEHVLYPVVEERFVLKNVRDCSNTGRTKKNLIFEYSGEETCRVIFSSRIKGFGPYFRSGIEENLDQLNNGAERVILSGFHNAAGNREAKLEKSRRQIEQLEHPIHIEYVHRDTETSKLIREKILPEADSLGMDGKETVLLAEDLDIDITGEPSLGECFKVSRRLIDRYGLTRVHIHTYRFQVTVTGQEYPVETSKIRDAMLYAQLAATETAGTGEFPSGTPEPDTAATSLEGRNELRDFGEFFSLEDFVQTGTAEIDGYRVAAIPVLIHEEPERLVGLGDVISAAAFTGELKDF